MGDELVLSDSVSRKRHNNLNPPVPPLPGKGEAPELHRTRSPSRASLGPEELTVTTAKVTHRHGHLSGLIDIRDDRYGPYGPSSAEKPRRGQLVRQDQPEILREAARTPMSEGLLESVAASPRSALNRPNFIFPNCPLWDLWHYPLWVDEPYGCGRGNDTLRARSTWSPEPREVMAKPALSSGSRSSTEGPRLEVGSMAARGILCLAVLRRGSTPLRPKEAATPLWVLSAAGEKEAKLGHRISLGK